MITPNSEIRLLKVPFEIDNRNQLTFANLTAQTNYFTGLTHLSYDNTTYQRKDNKIRFEAAIDSIISYNYVMYKNDSYSNKWFYAFITNMEYKNDTTTDITIQTDVFQTWQFDIIYKNMFVEREHVNDDAVGKNIVDEDLETGEFISNLHNKSTYVDNTAIVMGSTLDLNNTSGGKYGQINGDKINNLYSGVKYYAWYNANWSALLPVEDRGKYIEGMNSILNNIDVFGQNDGVMELFLAPMKLIGTIKTDHTIAGGNQIDKYGINKYETESSVNHLLTITNGTLDSYVPVNNKLKCFPYRYLLVSNNNGAEVTYKYEDFYTKNQSNEKIVSNQPQFEIGGCICPGCSIRMIPLNYKGIERNDVEGINLGKFPILSWNTDVYTNWLTQNSVNIAIDTIANIGSIAVGAYAMPEGRGKCNC